MTSRAPEVSQQQFTWPTEQQKLLDPLGKKKKKWSLSFFSMMKQMVHLRLSLTSLILSHSAVNVSGFKSCFYTACQQSPSFLSLNGINGTKRNFILFSILNIITWQKTVYIWTFTPSRGVKMINWFFSTEPQTSFLVFVNTTSLKDVGLKPSCGAADTQVEQWLWSSLQQTHGNVKTTSVLSVWRARVCIRGQSDGQQVSGGTLMRWAWLEVREEQQRASWLD